MKKMFTFALYSVGLFVITVISLYSQSWTYVGNEEFAGNRINYPDITVYNGEVYIVYQDLDNGQKANVMKFDGASWQQVGQSGFSVDKAIETRLAINSSGEIYVAFKDYDAFNRPTVMKYDGNSWAAVGNRGFSGKTADEIDIVVMNDVPYVAFQANNSGVVVYKFDGSSWVSVGNESGVSYGTARYVSLAGNSANDNLLLAHEAILTLQQKATCRRFNGSEWIDEGVPYFSEGNVSFVSLALDGDTPYVAYADDSNDQDGDITVMKFNGSEWENVGKAGFTNRRIEDLDLEIFRGQPYLVFKEPYRKASVMTYNGNEWAYVGTEGFSEENIDAPQLAIDNDGTLYVAYRGSLSRASVMKFEQEISGIRNTDDRKGAVVYPNPAWDEISLSGSFEDLRKVRLFNLMGFDLTGKTEILRNSAGSLKIDISNLSSGYYIIKAGAEAYNFIKK